jgi:beta-lactamase regulating signal transducer with metallopeptidase domain
VLRHERLGPLVAGLLRPRIVVPAVLADAPGAEALAWVLRHESAHIRRGDPLTSAAVQIVCILAWPVLPVWLAARRIRALMEQACDQRAVEGADGATRRRYGELLLALAESPRALGPVLAFGSPLRGRLRALAARRRWPIAAQTAVVAGVSRPRHLLRRRAAGCGCGRCLGRCRGCGGGSSGAGCGRRAAGSLTSYLTEIRG